jgi:hypothetical protein
MLFFAFGQFYLHFGNGFLNFFVDYFPILFGLLIFLQVLFTLSKVVQFELAEGEHVNDFELTAGVFVKFLEEIE